MEIRDFKLPHNKVPLNIPILGGPGAPPAQVRDALGRILQEGDVVVLQTVTSQPYRIVRIQPAPVQPGQPPGLMDIVLRSDARFIAPPDQRNQEFLRVMVAAEQQPQTEAPVPPPEPKPPVEQPEDEPSETLKDA